MTASGLLAAALLQGVLAALGGLYLIAERLQVDRKGAEDLGLVIHEEDPSFARHGHPWSTCRGCGWGRRS